MSWFSNPFDPSYTPPDIPLPNPVIVPEVPGGAGGIEVSPTDPSQVQSTSPDAPSLVSADNPPASTPQPTGMEPLPLTVAKWLGALVLLWVILTALTEYSDKTKVFGQALAGLILFAALYYLGPDKPDGTPGAFSNIKNLWS